MLLKTDLNIPINDKILKNSENDYENILSHNELL